MKQLLFVFLGGGIGSALRYLITKALNPTFDKFYLGTLAVNIMGCLIIGFVLGLSGRTHILSPNQTLLLASGFCGGFTTFSAFALEKHDLLKSGDFTYFLLYLAASIIFGLLAIAGGLWASRLI